MEIDITDFYHNACPKDYSASVAEIGDNAGADTWRAACDDSEDYFMLDSEEKRDAFRKYVREFGAWSDDEITAWSDKELNALFIQFVSGSMRDQECEQDEEYSDISEFNGRFYYYVGV
jgi:hypothetical protein